MHPSQRIVTHAPITEPWDAEGPVAALRIRDLDSDDIRIMIRSAPIRFVLANVGQALKWLPTDDCYAFWQGELKSHLYDERRLYMEDYPAGYFYRTSEWRLTGGGSVVVLDQYH